MNTIGIYESDGTAPGPGPSSGTGKRIGPSAGTHGSIPGFMSARRAAILGASTWIASLWIAIGGLIAMIYLSAVKEGENVARDTVFMVGAYVSQTMRSGDVVLESMRSMLAEQGITDRETYEAFVRSRQVHDTLRDRVSNMQEIDKAAFISAKGQVLNFSFKYPVPPISVADRDYFQEQMSVGAPLRTIGRVALDRGSGKWTFYIAKRLLDAHGMPMGVAIVGLKADFLSEFFANTTLHGSVAVVLQRSDGVVLTGSGIDHSAYGEQLQANLGELPGAKPAASRATILAAAPEPERPSVVVTVVDNPPNILTSLGAQRHIVASVGIGGAPARALVFVAEQAFLSKAVSWCLGLAAVGAVVTVLIALALRRGLKLIDVAESAAEEAKDRRMLAAIVNTPSALTAVIARDGRIVQANEKFWNAVSGNADRSPALLMEDHIGGRQALLDFAWDQGTDGDGTSKEFELQINKPRGKAFLHIAATRQELANMGPCVILVGHDVTDRLNFQAALAHSARLVTLGELTTGVAHELNQPLFAMSMAAENALADIENVNTRKAAELTVAASPQSPEEQLIGRLRKNLGGILNQVRRASGIVQNMRVFGRAENAHPGDFDLRIACQMALDLTSEQLRLAGIEVRAQLGTEPIVVHGVRSQLEQVLVNLLINARDAVSGADGRYPRIVELTIDKDAAQATARVNIRDSGTGVPEEIRSRIFDPFFTTKAVGKGVGLGLSISYGIMRDMGGRIALMPSREGADFQLDLQLAAG